MSNIIDSKKKIAYALDDEYGRESLKDHRRSKPQTVKLQRNFQVNGPYSDRTLKSPRMAPEEQYRQGRISQVKNTEEDDILYLLSSLFICGFAQGHH